MVGRRGRRLENNEVCNEQGDPERYVGGYLGARAIDNLYHAMLEYGRRMMWV